MAWHGLNVLEEQQECTDKNIPDVNYNVDVCRIRRAGETGTCFECRSDLNLGETVYKVHKQIEIPPKDNICLCQTCFTAGYAPVL
jgi:hypothetical protein